MVQPLLSVLFFGMIPAVGPSVLPTDAPHIAIAPPAVRIDVSERLSASGVLIIDQRSGQQLFARQATMRRPMASLTKLMTALIIREHHAMNELVTIQPQAAHIEGSKAYLPSGEQFPVGDLLSALLIPSANDAAESLATYHSGSIAAFVEEMNQRAKSLGLNDTSFANPTGLDDTNQWSTPQDIAWLLEAALRFPDLEDRLGKRGARLRSVEGTTIDVTHTHAMLHSDNPIVAGKTGTTNGARECLVSLVEEGDRRFTVVLLHSLRRYEDMQTILAALKPSSSSPDPQSPEEPVAHGG